MTSSDDICKEKLNPFDPSLGSSSGEYKTHDFRVEGYCELKNEKYDFSCKIFAVVLLVYAIYFVILIFSSHELTTEIKLLMFLLSLFPGLLICVWIVIKICKKCNLN